MTFDSGISFILRIKNEQETLKECIQSLRNIKVPHEIIVLLNQCTDSSAQIIRDELEYNSNIKIHHYDVPLSRAGYENLCTDAKSRHSLTYYWNLGPMLSKYPWMFDWDGDFVMTNPIKEYLASNAWNQANTPAGVRFHAVDDDGVMHGQEYLFSHHFYADKYWFWHLKQTIIPYQTSDPGLAIFHRSSLSKKKSYWEEDPWFVNDHQDEESALIRSRMEAVTDLLGPEIVGQARASNQESIALLTHAMMNEHNLMALGVTPSGGWFS